MDLMGKAGKDGIFQELQMNNMTSHSKASNKKRSKSQYSGTGNSVPIVPGLDLSRVLPNFSRK